MSIAELISLTQKVKRAIIKVCSTVYDDIQKLVAAKAAIMSSAPGLTPEIEVKLSRIFALESLIQNLGYVRLAGVYETQLQRLEKLRNKLEEFEEVKMNEMLSDLSTEICHYYNKLNPDEPITFTRLTTGGGRRQVRIEGESYGRKFNPVSCFSEAHANCLGLSLYLSRY